jgi:hypothetical protein
MAFYRYVVAAEHTVAVSSGRVPNIDRHGFRKTVYFTDSCYTRVIEAETNLVMGAFHPGGPTSSPDFRLDLDLTGISYTGPTPIVGSPSGAKEFLTRDRPYVTGDAKLTP